MIDKICLIVDDEPVIRDFVGRLLGTEGFRILEAETAQQAFRTVEKMNGSVDLVVTDVSMPGDMDGIDLAHALRNTFPRVPVIVMSGYPSPTARRPQGDFCFVPKPFRAEVLLAAVKRVSEPGLDGKPQNA